MGGVPLFGGGPVNWGGPIIWGGSRYLGGLLTPLQMATASLDSALG